MFVDILIPVLTPPVRMARPNRHLRGE